MSESVILVAYGDTVYAYNEHQADEAATVRAIAEAAGVDVASGTMPADNWPGAAETLASTGIKIADMRRAADMPPEQTTSP